MGHDLVVQYPEKEPTVPVCVQLLTSTHSGIIHHILWYPSIDYPLIKAIIILFHLSMFTTYTRKWVSLYMLNHPYLVLRNVLILLKHFSGNNTHWA